MPLSPGARFSALVLHSWTLDSTPVPRFIAAARDAGWDAIEIRYQDFVRARQSDGSEDRLMEQIREGAMPVACIGVQPGWMWARGAERRQLLAEFSTACDWARALECPLLMSTVDLNGPEGTRSDAIASLREVGAMALESGLVLAFEFSSQSPHVNSLARARDLVDSAASPGCRLLLDTYHLFRSGAGVGEISDLEAGEVAYVQYSDVPADTMPGMTFDRLAPGHGVAPIATMFSAILGSGYAGPISYEAPNPKAWERSPESVAREALSATRAVLSALTQEIS